MKKILLFLVLLDIARKGDSEKSVVFPASGKSRQNEILIPSTPVSYEAPKVTQENQKEGRTLNIFADLFFSAHCFVHECKKSRIRAYDCCIRYSIIKCCKISQGVAFSYPQQYPTPDGQNGVGGGSSFISSNPYPNYHHHFHEYHQQFPVMPSSIVPNPFIPPTTNPYIPPYGNPGLYNMNKPGECPSVRSSCTSRRCGGHRYPYRDGYDYYDNSSPSCSYDYECPSNEKCCYVQLSRGRFTMRCRRPRRLSYHDGY